MNDNKIINTIKEKYQILCPVFNERTRRLWAATEAKALGYGGQTLVSNATGIARRTIYAGIKELEDNLHLDLDTSSVRNSNGGRKSLKEHDPTLLTALDTLVSPTSRGDPENPLRWTCKSTRQLARELSKQGYSISYTKVAELLKELNYSLQAPRKTKEGSSHPDRNDQFSYINERVKTFQARGQPVISVDAKKKELVGNYYNKGQEWQPQGQPEEVKVYDFPDKELGKANPYGVYDTTTNEGWVSVGTSSDTAEFAIESINRWWRKMGKQIYPNAKELLIMADGGGSNSRRSRLWKYKLQELANKLQLTISVSHFPPGTSKWNKIEHRMFSYISLNWRGKPLETLETIVQLIASTTTQTGLRIEAEIDDQTYEKGIKVSDKQLQEINLVKDDFHGEWNYTIAFSL